MGENLCDHEVGKALWIKEKTDKLDFMKIKTFFLKDTVKKMKRQPPTGKYSQFIHLTKDLYLEYIKNYWL